MPDPLEPERAALLEPGEPVVPASGAGRNGLSWGAYSWIAFAGALLIFTIVRSRAPLPMTAIVLYALAPSLLALREILAYRKDPEVSPSFLIVSAFISAIPGMVCLIFFEFFVVLVSVRAIFGSTLEPLLRELMHGFRDLYGDVDYRTLSLDEAQRLALLEGTRKVLREVGAKIPVWRKLLTLVAIAFIARALVEQCVTQLVARRYRDLPPGQVRVRGVVACACAAALGIAAAQQKAIVCSMFEAASFWYAVRYGLVLGGVNFTVRLLTGFFIGVQSARADVLRERIGFWKIIGVPVLALGTVDFAVMLIMYQFDGGFFLWLFVICVVGYVIVRLGWKCVLLHDDVVSKDSAQVESVFSEA